MYEERRKFNLHDMAKLLKSLGLKNLGFDELMRALNAYHDENVPLCGIKSILIGEHEGAE